MPVKDAATTAYYYAKNTTTGAMVTGDAANHSLSVASDGTRSAVAATPSEVDATNMPGLYSVVISAGENDGDLMLVDGSSSTSNVELTPAAWVNDPVSLATIATNIATILGQIALAGVSNTPGNDPELIEINPGKDYDRASGTSIVWTITPPTSLTGGSGTFRLKTFAGDVVAFTNTVDLVDNGDGSWGVHLNAANAVTATLTANYTPSDEQYTFEPSTGSLQYIFAPTYTFDLWVETSGGIKIPVSNGLVKVPQL